MRVLDAVGKAGAGFRSLADAWADTTTPHGGLMLTVLGGLAEFERELIKARTDEGRIRAAAVSYGVPCVTTIPGCLAIVKALEAYVKDPVPRVRALQDWAKMDQAAVAVER